MLLALALLAAPVNQPAKLVVLFGASGIAITDYSSMARCESARRILLASAAKGEPTAAGTLVPIITAYCIPG